MKKLWFGIKFPFTRNRDKGHLFDLCESDDERIASDVMHVLLTRKGARLRMPEFGTRIIDFIFSQNDEGTWDEIEKEAKDAVGRNVDGVDLVSVTSYVDDENDNGIYLDMKYTVRKGDTVEMKRTIAKL